MKPDRNRIRALTSSLFAFLLTLFFVLLYLCAGLGIGVFNGKSISRMINETNYYNRVYEQIEKSSEAIVSEVGLPVSVLTDAVTLERVYISGKNYIQAAIYGRESRIKTDKLLKKLEANVEQYLLNQGISSPTEEQKAGMKELTAAIATTYQDGIKLQFVNYFKEYQIKYFNLLKLVVPILMILIAGLCSLLIKMHTYRHRGLRYITYALLAASLLTILTAGYFLVTKQYAGINVSPEYYKAFMTAYLQWDTTVFLYIGGIGVTISVALISFTEYLKKRITN